MPDLKHLWQRFLLASSLLVGVAVGVAVTVFGYSNLGSVDVNWSVFHVNGVPLWTVAVVPIALTVIAGTLYHWMNSFHHFTEHMRHRHRVHELEAEVASLRAHLDHVLDIPDQSTSRIAPRREAASQADEEIKVLAPSEMAALPEAANGEPKSADRGARGRKRATLADAPLETSAAEIVDATSAKTGGDLEPAPGTSAGETGAHAEKTAGRPSEA